MPSKYENPNMQPTPQVQPQPQPQQQPAPEQVAPPAEAAPQVQMDKNLLITMLSRVSTLNEQDTAVMDQLINQQTAPVFQKLMPELLYLGTLDEQQMQQIFSQAQQQGQAPAPSTPSPKRYANLEQKSDENPLVADSVSSGLMR